MPRAPYVPYYSHREPPPPPLTERQTFETWVAVRESVEGIIARCADKRLPGQDIFLVTPEAWCLVRVAGVDDPFTSEKGTRRNQLQVMEGGYDSVRWGWSLIQGAWYRSGTNLRDHLFAQGTYDV